MVFVFLFFTALDAYCLLEAYFFIMNECKVQRIPIDEIINEITKGQSPKKKKKEFIKKEGIVHTNVHTNNGINIGDALPPKKFRVLCDHTAYNVGKELRKYGIDTIILSKKHKPSVKLVPGVSLAVITRRRNCNDLIKYGCVLQLTTYNLREQLDQTFHYLLQFNLNIKAGDVQSRCIVSN